MRGVNKLILLGSLGANVDVKKDEVLLSGVFWYE